MTTIEHRAKIAALELELASKEKPCPGWEARTYAQHSSAGGSSQGNIHRNDCSIKSCNGTGIMALIAESRRDCPCTYIDYLRTPHCDVCWVRPDFQHSGDCKRCAGRNWVPHLTGMKVLAWMLRDRRSEVSFRTDLLSPSISSVCTWDIHQVPVLTKPSRTKYLTSLDYQKYIGKGATPYEALLRACLAGIRSNEARVEVEITEVE